MKTKHIVLLSILLSFVALPVLYFVLIANSYGIGQYVNWTAENVVKPKAEKYIAQTYPDRDFEIVDVNLAYDLYYSVEIQSPSSRDTHFTITYDGLIPELSYDHYESSVLSGSTIRGRLIEEYDALIQQTLGDYPGMDILNAGFCVHTDHYGSSSYFSPEGLDPATLELDREYDAGAMGWDYGTLQIRLIVEENTINLDGAYDTLIELDRILTEAGIGYRYIELRLFASTDPKEPIQFTIYDVTHEDLTCEDPMARLQEIWNEQEAKRQERRAQWKGNG